MQTLFKGEPCGSLHSAGRITPNQHAFTSYVFHCYKPTDSSYDWTLSLNSNTLADVIYIDFKKVFDSVVYSKLLLEG